MSEKKERYIPSMRIIKKAAESLPPAQTWRADTVHVPVNENRVIEFKKVRFKNKDGRTDRWVYEGKIIVS